MCPQRFSRDPSETLLLAIFTAEPVNDWQCAKRLLSVCAHLSFHLLLCVRPLAHSGRQHAHEHGKRNGSGYRQQRKNRAEGPHDPEHREQAHQRRHRRQADIQDQISGTGTVGHDPPHEVAGASPGMKRRIELLKVKEDVSGDSVGDACTDDGLDIALNCGDQL